MNLEQLKQQLANTLNYHEARRLLKMIEELEFDQYLKEIIEQEKKKAAQTNYSKRSNHPRPI